MTDTVSNITPISIETEMKNSFMDYAMSVIVARALPDARDGLKPVHRRILFAQRGLNNTYNRPYLKCARIVGDVIGKYHPHGDSAVYDALVRMAQDFSMRYPLIDGQGNFGSVDGDPPAAMRYTECRMDRLAGELLADIDKETVDWQPNYDDKEMEPTVMPTKVPNLLVNGASGIAVGMATNIPPHNLDEIINATCALIDQPHISVEELIEHIHGPDFPTGGLIVGREGIRNYMTTGRGMVRVRGRAHTEELKNGKEQIVVTEIPYGVNRENLVKHIAELVGDKKLTEVSDLRNESDAETRIVIELKRGESSEVVINKLFQLTQLESSFGVILLAIDHRRPKQMNIKELLECYLAHRREVITRRTQFRLRKAKERAEILEGYKIALDNLDDFVRIIRSSSNKEEAKQRLMEKYPINERQTDAILELRLYQLTGLERGKIEAEYLELLKAIEYYESILASEHLLMELIKTELLEMKAKYSQPRKSEIIAAEGEFRMEDVIVNEGCVITVSHQGFIKRTRVADYRVQKRGGKGIIGTETYDTDFVQHLFTASTHDYILFVTSTGKSYAKKVYDIPEGVRTAKGKSVSSFLKLVEGEKIAAMVCFSAFTDDRFLVLATRAGVVKKTMLSEYEGATRAREGGLAAINLREGDQIVGGVLSTGTNELVLVSHQGLAVRFQEGPLDSAAAADDESAAADASATAAPVEGEAEVGEVRVGLRATGRATGGVTGMRFKKKGDYLEAIEICDSTARLLVAREDGIGKRTPFEDYRLTRRGGSGVIAIDLPDDGSIAVAGALSVHDTDEIMLLTAKNQSVRCPVNGIRETGRGAKGVKLIDLAEGDKLLSIARIVDTREDDDETAAPVADTPAT